MACPDTICSTRPCSALRRQRRPFSQLHHKGPVARERGIEWKGSSYWRLLGAARGSCIIGQATRGNVIPDGGRKSLRSSHVSLTFLSRRYAIM